MTREPIYQALFAKLLPLKNSGLAVTCTRLLKHWNDVQDYEQPAIFMAQGDQIAEHQLKGSPYKWDLSVNIYVYVKTDGTTAPATLLNPILDAIENALSSKVPGMQQNLGGLCDTCYIDGAIQTFEGTLGTQEVAIIPIKILVR
jgi:hypothetical protein